MTLIANCQSLTPTDKKRKKAIMARDGTQRKRAAQITGSDPLSAQTNSLKAPNSSSHPEKLYERLPTDFRYGSLASSYLRFDTLTESRWIIKMTSKKSEVQYAVPDTEARKIYRPDFLEAVRFQSFQKPSWFHSVRRIHFLIPRLPATPTVELTEADAQFWDLDANCQTSAIGFALNALNRIGGKVIAFNPVTAASLALGHTATFSGHVKVECAMKGYNFDRKDFCAIVQSKYCESVKNADRQIVFERDYHEGYGDGEHFYKTEEAAMNAALLHALFRVGDLRKWLASRFSREDWKWLHGGIAGKQKLQDSPLYLVLSLGTSEPNCVLKRCAGNISVSFLHYATPATTIFKLCADPYTRKEPSRLRPLK
jgi:hypothetical protein